jgi:hypothetical protein
MKNIRPQHCATLEPIKSRSGVYASGSLGAIQFLRFTTWLEVTAERLTRAPRASTDRPARARFPVVIMLLIDRSLTVTVSGGGTVSGNRLGDSMGTARRSALSHFRLCRTFGGNGRWLAEQDPVAQEG